MSSLVLESHSEAQTREIAATLTEALHPGAIVALEGPLGSGKTMFVRGMAEGLGVDADEVSSPTFVICHEYESRRKGNSPSKRGKPAVSSSTRLVHIDAYRITSEDDLYSIGWSDLVEDESAIIAIEWPSRMAGGLTGLEERLTRITITHASNDHRTLSIEGPVDVLESLRANLDSARLATNARDVVTPCRTCGRPVNSSSPGFPFCSARCRMAELNKWFSEGYRISRPVEADDELSD